jgi:hypothetical protein
VMTFTMAIDQYGNHFDDLGKHPRKELMSRLDCKHADKMYRDTKDGTGVHVGYIIAGLWLELYHVKGWGEDK